MTQKNIAQTNATTFAGISAEAERSFGQAFAALGKAFMRRLNIERVAQGKSFDSKTFWADNDIAEDVIQSAYRRPKISRLTGKQVERKGKLVYETVRLNQRIVQSAASIIRSGVRTDKALEALTAKSDSLSDAVKLADSFGSVLRLVPRMNRAGLVSGNSAGNDAKNAAIAAFREPGETPVGSARKALISSLYGKPVTTAQVKLLTDALTAFDATIEPRTPLTFDGIFGTVVTMKSHTAKKAARVRRTKATPIVAQTETPTVEVTIEPTESIAV